MNLKAWLAGLAMLVMPPMTVPAQNSIEAAEPPGNPAAPISSAVSDVVKMAEAGTAESVLLAYVQNSATSFDLSADQILYLRDIGLSSEVISGMLSRDAALKSQTQPIEPSAQADATPVAPVYREAAPPLSEAGAEPSPPAYVSNPTPDVGYFYDQLSPYGAWIQLNDVGWCWQPTVVTMNRSWRPYCDSGHWVYTDAGWFWQSDYTWGWAPFHYGRWLLREGCGWVWTPDRVWGPAWVTWRYEGDHCGWAPLPPHADFDSHLGYCFNGLRVGFDFDFGLRPEHFTFISMHDFHERDYARHSLAPFQVRQFYNHTRVVNNYAVNNHTIVNRGIGVERVAAATHTQFHAVPIRDVPAGFQERANLGGHAQSAVYHRQLRAPARPVNMVAQKIDDRHPAIQHVPFAAVHRVGGAARTASMPQNTSGIYSAGRAKTQITPTVPNRLNWPTASVGALNSTAWTRTPERELTGISGRVAQSRPNRSEPQITAPVVRSHPTDSNVTRQRPPAQDLAPSHRAVESYSQGQRYSQYGGLGTQTRSASYPAWSGAGKAERFTSVQPSTPHASPPVRGANAPAATARPMLNQAPRRAQTYTPRWTSPSLSSHSYASAQAFRAPYTPPASAHAQLQTTPHGSNHSGQNNSARHERSDPYQRPNR